MGNSTSCREGIGARVGVGVGVGVDVERGWCGADEWVEGPKPVG